MYKDLYRYLILNKELNLPGIGTFHFNTNPVTFNFPDKAMMPPSYSISFHPGSVTPSKRFFNWLSSTWKISERDAIIRFNDFAFELKNQLTGGAEVFWNGVGKLYKGATGDIRFISVIGEIVLDGVVSAEKIFHENATHPVRVGEEEKTNSEMSELLNQPEESSSNWWAVAIIVGLLAVMFTGWHFSTHGVNVFSTANQMKINPVEMSATHIDLQ